MERASDPDGDDLNTLGWTQEGLIRVRTGDGFNSAADVLGAPSPCRTPLLTFVGYTTASTKQGMEPGKITEHVFSKSDVQTMEDRPLQVLVVAVPSARFDSLLRAADGPEEPTGDIIVVTGSIRESFAAYATGHDVSGKDGQYRI